MFVINPDPYSLPCYRIGPFQTKDLSINHNLPDSDHIDEYINNRFKGKDIFYTYNGRQAIHYALKSFDLKEDDIITILTTTGNFYISGCVTNEIEKFCSWSRKIEPETKVIFVNHEFGYPYPDLKALKKRYNLPIIEDCASSFFSNDPQNDIGNVGDFVIYSFPKMFPLQIGGLLVSNQNMKLREKPEINRDELRHIKNVLSSQIDRKEVIINTRIKNYKSLRAKFETLGFMERFSFNPGSVPGVFMFNTKGHKIDLPELKRHFYAHGIQCSVFYGEEAFFIPVHQALTEEDLEYFLEVMKAFL